MIEPTYTYVKGQGWILETFESVEATMRDGTRVRLEARNPTHGECFLRSMSWLGADGKPEMHNFKDCLVRYYSDLDELRLIRTFNTDTEYILNTPEYALVTVVVL